MSRILRRKNKRTIKSSHFTSKLTNQHAGSSTPNVSLRLFALLFVLAISLLILAEEVLKQNETIKTVLEHTASAFIVASLIGFSYEYLLNERRERTFRQLFDDHREAMFESLRVYMVLTPEKIFELLRDIVVQSDKIPTLYKPARNQGNEFTFADSIEYFNTLIPLRRTEIVKALETWLHPKSHHNLKFLASDLIGMFQLHELVPKLDLQISEKLREWDEPDEWDKIEVEDKGWILNYVWASSRCEDSMYQKLERLLVTTKDSWVQEWILFVPRQTPDRELCGVIKNYLNRDGEIQDNCLKHVIIALAALKQAGATEAQEILIKSASLFKAQLLVDEIDSVWRLNGFDPEPILTAIKKITAQSHT